MNISLNQRDKKFRIILITTISICYTTFLIRNNLFNAPIQTPDSALYFEFNLLKSVRMPGIVLPYILLKNHIVITVFHLLLNCVAFTYLLIVLNVTSKELYVLLIKIFILITLLVNSFATRWINIIMSESITISLTVILIGTIILLFYFPNSISIFVLNNIVIIFFSSVKQASAMIGILIFLVILYISRRLKFKGKSIIVLISFSLFTYLIFLSFSVDNISGYNLIAILGYRVMTNLEWRNWFEARGLPTNFLESMQVENSGALDINAALVDPKIVQWLENQGMQDYLKFSITHLDYTFFGPFFPQIFGEIHGFGSSLVWNNLLLENLVWGSFFKYILIVLAILISLLFIVTRHEIYENSSNVKANLVVVIISILWAYLVWQLAPGDFTRTQFPSGLMLAIASGFLIVDVASSVYKEIFLREQVSNKV